MAVLLACMNVFIPIQGLAAENLFVLDYTYENDIVTAVLSVSGEINVCGFEAVLHYDKDKYTVDETTPPTAGNYTLLNVLPESGEVVVVFAGTTNLKEAAEFFTIQFVCNDKASESDFEFEMIDIYDQTFAAVKYSVDKNWNQENVGSTEDNPSSETTIQSSETAAGGSDNIFYVEMNESADGKSMELIFGVKGDVCFSTAEGSIALETEGLLYSEHTDLDSDTLSAFYADENMIYFTVISSTGNNIEKEKEFFKYTFSKTDEKYRMNADCTILDICDRDLKDVSYSVSDSSENDAESTSTSVIGSETTITTTTTSSTEPSTDSDRNCFVITAKETADGQYVALTFEVQGDVEFCVVEGLVLLQTSGLSAPQDVTVCSGGLTNYIADDHAINFTVISDSGKNITEKMQIFSCLLPIVSEDYSIRCAGNITDICDQDMNSEEYAITFRDETGGAQSTTSETTTSVTTTKKETTTTTTTSKKETTTTTTTSKKATTTTTTTSKKETTTTTTTSKKVTTTTTTTSKKETTTTTTTSKKETTTTTTTSKKVTTTTTTTSKKETTTTTTTSKKETTTTTTTSKKETTTTTTTSKKETTTTTTTSKKVTTTTTTTSKKETTTTTTTSKKVTTTTTTTSKKETTTTTTTSKKVTTTTTTTSKKETTTTTTTTEKVTTITTTYHENCTTTSTSNQESVSSSETLTVTAYTYTIETNPIQYYFSHDEEEFDVEDLITSVIRYKVYSDGSISEKGEHLKNLAIVDFNGQTPASLYKNGEYQYTVEASIADEFSTQTFGVDVFVGVKGDANLDGYTDAKDAAQILVYAAASGAGKKAYLYSETDEELERFVYYLADVNGTDAEKSPLNATDAAAVLVYAAAAGSGTPKPWKEILGVA